MRSPPSLRVIPDSAHRVNVVRRLGSCHLAHKVGDYLPASWDADARGNTRTEKQCVDTRASVDTSRQRHHRIQRRPWRRYQGHICSSTGLRRLLVCHARQYRSPTRMTKSPLPLTPTADANAVGYHRPPLDVWVLSPQVEDHIGQLCGIF